MDLSKRRDERHRAKPSERTRAWRTVTKGEQRAWRGPEAGPRRPLHSEGAWLGANSPRSRREKIGSSRIHDPHSCEGRQTHEQRPALGTLFAIAVSSEKRLQHASQHVHVGRPATANPPRSPRPPRFLCIAPCPPCPPWFNPVASVASSRFKPPVAEPR